MPGCKEATQGLPGTQDRDLSLSGTRIATSEMMGKEGPARGIVRI